MKDKGLDKGLIREFNASDRDKRGWAKGFFGFRKMFWDYLNKLNVPFYDACCPEVPNSPSPVRNNDGVLESFNGTAWEALELDDLTVGDDLTINDTLSVDTVAEKTAAHGVIIDGTTVKDGGITTTSASTTDIGGLLLLSGTPQTLTGAGAVNLTTKVTLLVTTGANALTLAAGTAGQIKIITMKTDGGDGTLTPVGLRGGTTLTFGDVGDTVTLLAIDSAWVILGNSGVALA